MVNSKVIKLAIFVYSFHYTFSVDNEFISSTLTEQNSRCRAEFQSLSRLPAGRISQFRNRIYPSRPLSPVNARGGGGDGAFT